MTMRKRILISAGVVATCVSLTLGVLAMLPSRPEVTKANYDRVQNGMTKAEVENLFGGEASTKIYVGGSLSMPEQIEHMWIGHGGFAFLTFDGYYRTGRVLTKSWAVEPESGMKRLRRWLKLT